MTTQEMIRPPWRLRYLMLLAAAGAWLSLAPGAFGAADPAPCAVNPQNRQLDFWVGDWTIAGPGSQPTATSRVYLALDQCVVVESWNGGRGHAGENMFAYSKDDHSWHGMFADNEGRVHVFVDGTVGSDSAVFSGPSRGPQGEILLNRVSITRVASNKVEQTWQKSSDNGVTWSTMFRGEYSRKNQ